MYVLGMIKSFEQYESVTTSSKFLLLNNSEMTQTLYKIFNSQLERNITYCEYFQIHGIHSSKRLIIDYITLASCYIIITQIQPFQHGCIDIRQGFEGLYVISSQLQLFQIWQQYMLDLFQNVCLAIKVFIHQNLLRQRKVGISQHTISLINQFIPKFVQFPPHIMVFILKSNPPLEPSLFRIYRWHYFIQVFQRYVSMPLVFNFSSLSRYLPYFWMRKFLNNYPFPPIFIIFSTNIISYLQYQNNSISFLQPNLLKPKNNIQICLLFKFFDNKFSNMGIKKSTHGTNRQHQQLLHILGSDRIQQQAIMKESNKNIIQSQYLFILQFINMIKHWFTFYVILLCSYPSSFFPNDLLLFGNTMINKRVGKDLQSFYHTKNYAPTQHNPPTNFDSTHQGMNLQSQLVEKSIQSILEYSGKFRKLKFNLEQEELRVLAYDVKDLYEKNRIAKFFISAYFIRACQLLEIKNVSSVDISKLIKIKIKQLMNLTSIETYRKQKYGGQSLQVPPNYWRQVENMVVEMTPKLFKLDNQNKDQQVENIIMEMVQQAKSKYDIFNYITSESCRLNNGLSHHINYKLQNRAQIHEMKRIKQKLLRTYLLIYGDKSFKRRMEEIQFQQLLNKIYSKLNYLQFVVKDLLRAKCMFHNVQQILSAIKTTHELVERLKVGGLNIKIVQFENRLNKTTCDIVIVIQIGPLAYEIQFALEFDETLFQISHKMYELSRSKVFSPIVLLFNWFQKTAPQFLSKIGQFLVQNEQLAQKNRMMKQIKNENSRRLLKQYELLNNFFNLTSYHDLTYVSGEQFQKQITEEIQRTSFQIKNPIIKSDYQFL